MVKSLFNRRAVIVHKPDHPEFVKLTANLEKQGRKVIHIETAKDGAETKRRLAAQLLPEDLVLGLGGDGTASVIGNVLLEQNLSKVIFIPLRGGNANDLAHMLNGNISLDKVLSSGKLTRCYPLEVEIKRPKAAATTGWALAYFSIGASAYASQNFDRIKNRLHLAQKMKAGSLYEKSAVWNLLNKFGTYNVTPTETGVTEQLADCVFLRGDRVAKYGRPRASLASRHYELMQEPRLSHIRTLRAMIQLMHGRHVGWLMTEPYECMVESKNGEPLPVQFDGEPSSIPSGSMVRVSISEKSYQTIAAKL